MLSNRDQEAQLANLFALIPRGFVVDGSWARLWHRDRGLAASVLPVLAVVAAGRPGGWIHTRDLLELSGLTATELDRARLTLHRYGPLRFVPSGRRGIKRFEFTAEIPPPIGVPRFYIPGQLLTTNTWSTWTAEERLVALALAALVDPILVGERLDDVDSLLWEWFDRIEAIEYPGDDFLDSQTAGQPAVRRFGEISLSDLRVVTRLDWSTSKQVLDGMLMECDEDDEEDGTGTQGAAILGRRVSSDAYWIHLHRSWWEPAAGTCHEGWGYAERHRAWLQAEMEERGLRPRSPGGSL